MNKLWIKVGLIGSLFATTLNGMAAESGSGSFFNLSAIGPNLQINTTTPGRTYPGVGISMQTSGFSLTSPGGSCTLSSNGMCLFSADDQTITQIPITGPAGNVKVKLCLNGAGAMICQSPLLKGNRFLYTVNFNTNPGTAYKCNLNTDTQLVDPDNPPECTQMYPTLNNQTALTSPQGVVLNPAGNFIYYADNDATPPNNNITFCPIDPSTGLENNDTCQQVSGQSIIDPINIEFNAAGTYAYILEEGRGDGVKKCNANQVTGELSSCVATTDYNWGDSITGSSAYGMAFNPRGTLAYITKIADQGVVKCTVIPSTGDLVNCGDAATPGQTINQPTGIAINSTGTFAFIASAAQGTQGTGYAYSCPINRSTGDFGTCVQYNIVDANDQLYDLALASTDNMLYITDYNTQKIYQCPVNTVTGVIATNNCTPLNLNDTPFGIAVR